MNIGVLGGGAWGTALASVMAQDGDQVTLWARDEETVQSINAHHRNDRHLPGIALPLSIAATSAIEQALDAKIVLCVIPTQSLGAVLPEIARSLSSDATLILCSKGIDCQTGLLPHQLAVRHIESQRVAALSGPSFAHDVANGLPTAVSLAAHDLAAAQQLCAALARPGFRIYASDDLLGVELGGALKNVLALAVGIARGLKLGASAEAALIARGFAEMQRLAFALGARPETLAGLSGLGDLVLTCSSTQSRNFTYGVALGEGSDVTTLKLAEGVHTAAMALQLAQRSGVDTPIVETVCAVLDTTLTAREAVAQLLARPLKAEELMAADRSGETS
ncbi:MAG: NAD(P)-dependent glycerol-3-phosphate dehydrogenase [Ahrensia sp.]|nr:NAD(P)-dependent glycerol-3-phosphate dehydrogenase [Ahrensia sp.]